MLKLEFPIKDQKREKEEMKRKKRKGKEGFPIEDLKKVKRLKLLQIWNHLLLKMFKFHILDLLLGFSFVKILFILLM